MWSVKDRATANGVLESRSLYSPVSFQPGLASPPRRRSRSHQQSQAVGPSAAPLLSLQTTDDPHHVGEVEEGGGGDGQNTNTISSEYVFITELYLSSQRDQQEFLEGNIHPASQPHLHFGRPNIVDIFQRTRGLCIKEHIKRVAVGVCGPQSMVDAVDDLCRRSKMSTDSAAVRFDCHKEVFSF